METTLILILVGLAMTASGYFIAYLYIGNRVVQAWQQKDFFVLLDLDKVESFARRLMVGFALSLLVGAGQFMVAVGIILELYQFLNR